MASTADAVLLVGDPRLRRVSAPVVEFGDAGFVAATARLAATLAAFRAEHGFGRAISAPQIGVAQRFIALALPGAPRLVVNPEVTWRSDETFTMWDDCMSFPSLLVRVRRHDSISLRFRDELGAPHEWERMGRAEAELLQHEIDHLDGVLALDLALDREAIVHRDVFDANREHFRELVDYVIA
jgi:peptide deformylase